MKSWKNATTDISTAFLNAPRRQDGRLVAMEPPSVFRRLGLIREDELLWVRLAMYGLTTSPRDWSTHRDKQIPKFKWTRMRFGVEVSGGFEPSGDDNLWRIQERVVTSGELLNTGLMTIYVDDILISAEEGAMNSAMDAIGRLWTCSSIEVASPDHAIKFCGFEVMENENGDGIHVHQRMYEKELLERWDVKEGVDCPNYKMNEEEDEEVNVDEMKPYVREAQQLAGSLLWLSTRTRPDLACGVAVMGRLVSKNPKRAVMIGQSLLKYLKNNPGDLHYTKEVMHKWGPRNQLKIPRTEKTIEVFSDISYASDGCRSVQGILVCVAGCPISWSSSRQAYATHSTSEAELTSYCESLVAGRATESLMSVIWNTPVSEDGAVRVIYGDNLAAIALAKGCGQASWRTRHLRIRSRLLRDALEGKGPDEVVWELHHLRGTELPADGLTKPLCGLAFKHFVKDLGMNVGEKKTEAPLPQGDAPLPNQGNAAKATATIMISSLMMAEAVKENGEEADMLWIGAVGLMVVGLVYAGKIAVNGVKCCLRKLRTRDDSVVVIDESEGESESEAATSSMSTQSGSATKGMSTQSGSATKGMSSRSGVATTSMPTRSGSATRGMSSRSGVATSSMTSRSGSAESSMTSQSGSATRTTSTGADGKGRKTGKKLSVEKREPEPTSTATSSASMIGGNGSAGSSQQNQPVGEGRNEGQQQPPNGMERADYEVPKWDRTNPRMRRNLWNEFQKANKGRGWSSTIMAVKYKEWKNG